MRRVVPTNFPESLISDALGFGAAVRSARTATGLTLAQAAMAIGVAKQTLQDLETGTGTVGINLALKIAHEIGVSVFVVPSTEKDLAVRAMSEVMVQRVDGLAETGEGSERHWERPRP